ncbi:MAG: phosphoribosylaminoimidazolesuccinocarboxamide synthase [bacterium]|nr:phosphoribosylaminoimidazolesuccinocarboxamide synthase [bacterium]
MPTAVISTDFKLPCRQGKVRDVYDLGDSLWIISTDRISAFDWVLPNGIPDKGVVLTQISRFWFEALPTPNHLLRCGLPEIDELTDRQRADLLGRSMLVKKAEVVPFECVVRGYLEGSGWREYQQTGSVCGVALPKGLRQCDRLPEPIFTPATKAAQGHDENVSFEYMANQLGREVADQLRSQSLEVYRNGCKLAQERGIIIADTKFEWGWHGGELILIDEVLTPDSSRFWPAASYAPGGAQPSYDKQFVREWLMASDWDRDSPPPELPDEIVEQTRQKYIDVFQQLTQKEFTA